MKIVEVQAIKGVDQVVEEVKITQVPVIKAATEVQERVEEAAMEVTMEMKEAVAKLPLIPRFGYICHLCMLTLTSSGKPHST